MQIYCDESGGFDGDKHSFVVSAVRISGHDASRLMKKFRKASRLAGEIKGSTLSEAHRTMFFDMLAEMDHIGAVVGCHRTSLIGSVVQRHHPERDIYQCMLVEACAPLFDVHAAKVNVMADGGRYSKPVYAEMGANLEATLAADAISASFEFVRSDNNPGVQVADIVSNTVYRSTAEALYDLSDHAICGTLFRAGRLVVAPAKLGTLKPLWMAAE